MAMDTVAITSRVYMITLLISNPQTRPGVRSFPVPYIPTNP